MTSSPDPLAAFAEALAAARDGKSAGADMLIAVAHPDDETIGLGGHLAWLRQATIVHLTDGAPRNGADASRAGYATPADYAAARRRELEAAMAEAGIAASTLTTLGIADQEAAANLAAIARRLRRLIALRRPRFVLTHPFEGGHPDHDAAAMAVWAACRLTGNEAPAVIEMASYHLDPTGPVFLRFAGGGPELAIPLDAQAQTLKRRMLGQYATQQEVIQLLTSDEERFRAAPRYDFTQLPNDGRLLYESWSLGLTGREWLGFAAKAMADLKLDHI